MKTFHSIKNCFADLGFDSPQSTQKDLLKFKNILSILLMGIDMILASVYVYFEANNFEEYCDGIYLLSALILAFFSFTTMFRQIPMLYVSITRLESTITKSK